MLRKKKIYSSINAIDGCMSSSMFAIGSKASNTVSRSNESEKLAVRYRKFDLKALVNIAENVEGNSGRSCTMMLLSDLLRFPFLFADVVHFRYKSP